MRRGCLVGFLLVAPLALFANVAGSNYALIPERNVFGLKAPAPVVSEKSSQERQMPKVALNGITTILGRKQALFKLAPPNARAAEEVESLILGEGERQGPLEVVKINADKGTVQIRNSGSPMTITFEETPSTATNAVPSPGNARTPTPAPVTAGFMPNSTNAHPSGALPTAPFANSRFPNRGPRPGDLPATVPGQIATPAAPYYNPNGQQLSPEESAVLMEIQARAQAETATPSAPSVLPSTGAEEPYRYQEQRPVFPPRAPSPGYPAAGP